MFSIQSRKKRNSLIRFHRHITTYLEISSKDYEFYGAMWLTQTTRAIKNTRHFGFPTPYRISSLIFRIPKFYEDKPENLVPTLWTKTRIFHRFCEFCCLAFHWSIFHIYETHCIHATCNAEKFICVYSHSCWRRLALVIFLWLWRNNLHIQSCAIVQERRTNFLLSILFSVCE